MTDFDTPIIKKDKPKSANPGDLSKMLEGYNTPIDISQPAPSTQSTQLNTPTQTPPNPGYINKDTHFVRGAKKGQLKPPSLQRPSVTYTPPQGEQTVSGGLLSPVLFLILIDFIFPVGIAAINNRFSDKKIEYKTLQLDADQKKALEPVTDALIKEIKLKGNPMVIFPIMLLCMYGGNFAMLKMLQK
jgi:hypothetical protein